MISSVSLMNKFFKKNSIFVFAGLMMISCQQLKSNLNGGQDSGGGNTSQQQAATSEQVMTTLRTAHDRRLEIFRSMTFAGLVAHRTLAAESQLSKPLTAQDRQKYAVQNRFWQLLNVSELTRSQELKPKEDLVNSLSLDVLTSRPCLDRYGNETDASIFPTRGVGICMSELRLTKRLSNEDHAIEILALYIHELSHHFGATESEAQAIQNLILTVGAHPENSLVYLIESKDDILKKDNLFLREGLNLYSSFNIDRCSELRIWTKKYFDFFVKRGIGQQGLMWYSIEKQIIFHTLFVVSTYTNDICLSDSSPEKQLRKNKFWNEKENKLDSKRAIQKLFPDPLNMLLLQDSDVKVIYSQFILADLLSVSVSWTNENDLQAGKENLSLMQDLLTLAIEEN